jgi:hypothetical protein
MVPWLAFCELALARTEKESQVRAQCNRFEFPPSVMAKAVNTFTCWVPTMNGGVNLRFINHVHLHSTV